MRMRWLALAFGAAVLVTLLAWAPWFATSRSGAPSLDTPPRTLAGESNVAPGGCRADAKPAKLDLTLKDMYGRDVRLADYKGKVLLINFWATWCAPCRVEIPDFVELQAKYKDRGFAIIGISISDGMEELQPFAREFDVNYPLVMGRERDDVQEAYGPITGVPISLLVGRDGRICSTHMGLTSRDEFERGIKALL